MIDKVQKIHEEVEKLMYGFNLEADIASCEDAETEKLANIKYQLCKKILDYIDSLQEEPISEDLEVELKNYLNSDEYINTLGVSGYLLIARHFANWQKNKMMKDAVDGEVGYWNQRGLSIHMELPRELEVDDKCKVIIIKED